MVLSPKLRANIAYQLIRVAVPVVIGAVVFSAAAIHILAPSQPYRYYPLVVALVLMIPVWFFSKKGRHLLGAHFLVACFIITIATGMFVSGGVHAPIFKGLLSLAAIVVCFYGTLRAVIFMGSMVLMGAIFVFLEQQQLLPQAMVPSSALILMIDTVWLAMCLFFYTIPVNMMQKALKEKEMAEKELHAIVNKTPDIIYRLSPEGRITFISDAIENYGYRPEQIKGCFIMDFIHPEDRTLVERGVLERRTGKRSASNVEVRFKVSSQMSEKENQKSADDQWTAFHISSNGIYADDRPSEETYIGVQGVARDISKAKHYEEQLNTLAAVVEQAAEDVVITDKKGIIKYVNPTFEKVTGYRREEVIGKTPEILKSGKHDKAFYIQLWKTITQGGIWKGHIWNRVKDGGLILQDVTITPILGTSKKLIGYASVRRDITLQNTIQEQLQQSQKMEAIGTLAGGIAHDFNNILSGIIGYTDLALEDVEHMPDTRDKLQRVLEAGRRATDLVRQILSFSRSQKKEPMPISPQIITKEVLKLLRASLPATIEIKQSLTSKSYIFADTTNIHQVLMNLCTNAGYAMRDSGGTLFVGLEDVGLQASEASTYVGLSPGKFIKITVKDTGCGIAEEIRKRVFDPFFTTKALGEGTGMGLSAVHGIVKELGGAVSLESEVGRGTTFEVLIPAITELADSERPAERIPPMGGTERILFVDDESVQIDLAEASLGRMGYRVDGFSDSVAALEHFQQHSADYDLIISDMTMPKMTGDKLVQKMRLIRPDIAVIVCTGFSEVLNEETAKAININAFLHKPVVARELLETIRMVLDKKK